MRAFDEVDHPVFDGDNHYYEAADAFTRHLDPALGPRVIQWCEIGRAALPRHRRAGEPRGHQSHLRPRRPTGAMYEYFRGNPHNRNPMEFLTPRTDPSRVPAARRPGCQPSTSRDWPAVWLFPTLG